MRVISLQSGSNGNCIYVEARDVRLIFDAGISGKRAAERLAGHGRNIRDADALLISHDHADHMRSAGIFQRKFALPIYASEPTLAAALRRQKLGKLSDVRHFAAGETLRFDGLSVETVRTPHDAADGVAFVVDDGRKRLGILTDLGHCFNGLGDVLAGCDAVIVESNYDPLMLETGPYPYALQRRISGPRGHISNGEAGELMLRFGRRLKWACLGHLSGDNNTPEIALETVRDVLRFELPVHLAGRYAASEEMVL